MDKKRSGPENVGLANLLRQAENPFDSYKVLTARDSVVDVPEIHQREFEKLNAELDKVKKSGKSRGVLVKGIAGSGKSHLIARLYNERPKEALFFQVQALPGGTAWFRQILQCIVSDLEQPISREEETPQLIMLIRHFIDGVRHELGRSNKSGYSFDTLNRALDARQHQIQKTIPSPLVQDVLAVLANLWKWQAPSTRAKKASQTTRKTDLAVQWLKAVMIDEDDLAEIGAYQNLGANEDAGQLDYLNVLRVFGYPDGRPSANYSLFRPAGYNGSGNYKQPRRPTPASHWKRCCCPQLLSSDGRGKRRDQQILDGKSHKTGCGGCYLQDRIGPSCSENGSVSENRGKPAAAGHCP